MRLIIRLIRRFYSYSAIVDDRVGAGNCCHDAIPIEVAANVGGQVGLDREQTAVHNAQSDLAANWSAVLADRLDGKDSVLARFILRFIGGDFKAQDFVFGGNPDRCARLLHLPVTYHSGDELGVRHIIARELHFDDGRAARHENRSVTHDAADSLLVE